MLCVCVYVCVYVCVCVCLGSLLEFLKDGEGRGLKLPNLVDMAAQVCTESFSIEVSLLYLYN